MHRHARKRLEVKGDLELAAQEIVGAAHSVAHTEIIRRGQVWEQDVIYRAIDGAPELFQTIYLDVLANPPRTCASCPGCATRSTGISTRITGPT